MVQLRFTDANDTIRAFTAGRQFRNNQQDRALRDQNRNRLIEAGKLASQGNFAGARDSALGAGLINEAAKFQQFDIARMNRAQAARKAEQADDLKNLEIIAQNVSAAQNPEQLELAKQDMRQKGIPENVVNQVTFENRDFFINRVIPTARQMQLELDRERLQLQNKKLSQVGSPKFGRTPVRGVDENGNPVLFQLSDRGGARRVQLPDGARPTQNQFIDLGTERALVDKNTGQRIQTFDKNIGRTEQAKIEARTSAEFRTKLLPKLENSLKSLKRRSKLIDDNIVRAVQQAQGLFNTGFTGSILAAVPGTPAFNLRSTLETIRSNIGFRELQTIRENSPTGGALGQVTEFENKLLQAVQGSLEQGQVDSQLISNLLRIREELRAGVEETQAALEADKARFGALSPQSQTVQPAQPIQQQSQSVQPQQQAPQGFNPNDPLGILAEQQAPQGLNPNDPLGIID